MDLDKICVEKKPWVLYDFLYLYNPFPSIYVVRFIVNYKNM